MILEFVSLAVIEYSLTDAYCTMSGQSKYISLVLEQQFLILVTLFVLGKFSFPWMNVPSFNHK